MSSHSSEESQDDDELLRAFTEFGTSPELASVVDAFVLSNCRSFQGANLREEHCLGWTLLHAEYVDLIELHLESFCKEHGSSTSDVFDRIRAVNEASDLHEDFVPQVIRMCDYGFFASNMKEAADAKENLRLAATLAQGSSSTNLSGCYRAMGLFPMADIEAYYAYTKVP